MGKNHSHQHNKNAVKAITEKIEYKGCGVVFITCDPNHKPKIEVFKGV